MSRGIRKTNEDKMAELELKKEAYNEKISKYVAKIKELNGEIVKIKDEISLEKGRKIADIATQTGKSLDEIMSLVAATDDNAIRAGKVIAEKAASSGRTVDDYISSILEKEDNG